MLGTVIKEAREGKGITQKDLGKGSYLSYKTISAIETGRRGITQENLKTICNGLDDPRVYMEAVNEVCGGVFSIQWLDGDAADLHRASVKEKVVEELVEALDAINLTKVYKNPRCCDTQDVNIVERSIQETIDVYIASAIYVAIMCKEYSLDIKEMFSTQKQKLISRGYLKGEVQCPVQR